MMKICFLIDQGSYIHYRFAMLGESFPNFKLLTIYYWIITIVILIFGSRIFNKLKTHFSDVL